MTDPYEGWAIVELMGHRRLAGRVSQAEQYGTVMLRIDVPREDGSESTHFFGGASIYGVHPTTEEVARQMAAQCDPSPVQRWELPALPERMGSPSEYGEPLCVDCAMLEGDCMCGGDDDGDDEPCDDPETGPPAAKAVVENDCDCKPGKPCHEHTPF